MSAIATLSSLGFATDSLITNGTLQRVAHSDDPATKRDLWYVLNIIEGKLVGTAGDWRSRFPTQPVSDDTTGMTPEQIAAIQAESARLSEIAAKERHERAAAAKVACTKLLAAAADADPTHPYLVAKQVASHGIAQSACGQYLHVPCLNADGEIVSMQTIAPTGAKKFYPGGQVKDTSLTIAGSSTVVLVEGYATGATVHKLTGWTVIICWNTSNLVTVAARHPRAIVAADNDHHTDGNPGLAAAQQTGLPTIYPAFDPTDPGTDWNDAACSRGEDVVAGELLVALPQTPKDWLSELKLIPGKADRIEHLMGSAPFIETIPDADWPLIKAAAGALTGVGKREMDALRGATDLATQDEDDAQRQLAEVEQANRTLNGVFAMPSASGYTHYLFRDGKTRVIANEQMTPLVSVATSQDKAAASQLFDHIHSSKRIGMMKAKVARLGASTDTMRRTVTGEFEALSTVSVEETLRAVLEGYADVVVSPSVEIFFKDGYPEVFDIYEAALARKFAPNKASYVWLRAPSNYGKTFFMDIPGLTRKFEHQFTNNDFIGNDPAYYSKFLLFFIDEAYKFTREMKNDTLNLRKNYGGEMEIDMPLRVIASANPIADLEDGADRQLLNRVTKVWPTTGDLGVRIEKELHMDTGEAKQQFDKIVLEHLLKCLTKVGSTTFRAFLEKYACSEEEAGVTIEETVIRELAEYLTENLNSDGVIELDLGSGSGAGLARYLRVVDGALYISKARRFIDDFATEIMGEKHFSFRKAVGTVSALAGLFKSHNTSHRIGDIVLRSIKCELEIKVEDGARRVFIYGEKGEKLF